MLPLLKRRQVFGCLPTSARFNVVAQLGPHDYLDFIKMACLYHFIPRCFMPKIEFYSISIPLKLHSLLGFQLNCSMREYLGNRVNAIPFGLEIARKTRHPRTVYKHQIPNHKLLFCIFLFSLLLYLFFVGYGRYRLELTTLPHGPTNAEGRFFIIQPKYHLSLLHIN